MSTIQKIKTHIKEIFTTGNGYYMNEAGETVYGKLPRTKVENPIKTLMRPTFMNYVYFFVGWMAWTMDGYVSVINSIYLLVQFSKIKSDMISTPSLFPSPAWLSTSTTSVRLFPFQLP